MEPKCCTHLVYMQPAPGCRPLNTPCTVSYPVVLSCSLWPLQNACRDVARALFSPFSPKTLSNPRRDWTASYYSSCIEINNPCALAFRKNHVSETESRKYRASPKRANRGLGTHLLHTSPLAAKQRLRRQKRARDGTHGNPFRFYNSSYIYIARNPPFYPHF